MIAASVAQQVAAGLSKQHSRTFRVEPRAVTGFGKGVGRQVVGFEQDIMIGSLAVASVSTKGAVRWGVGASQMPAAIAWADAQVGS